MKRASMFARRLIQCAPPPVFALFGYFVFIVVSFVSYQSHAGVGFGGPKIAKISAPFFCVDVGILNAAVKINVAFHILSGDKNMFVINDNSSWHAFLAINHVIGQDRPDCGVWGYHSIDIGKIKIVREPHPEFCSYPIQMEMNVTSRGCPVVGKNDNGAISRNPSKLVRPGDSFCLRSVRIDFDLDVINATICSELPLGRGVCTFYETTRYPSKPSGQHREDHGYNYHSQVEAYQNPIIRRFFGAIFGYLACVFFTYYGLNHKGVLSRAAWIAFGVFCGGVGGGLFWATNFKNAWRW